MKISIITPVRNAESTIRDTMDSVAMQEAEPLEHIIIDGSSSDKTLRVVEQERKSYTKVFSERDTGIYDAINKGIGRASGEIVGLIHADDIYPDRGVLSTVARVFETTEVDCCYGDNQYVSSVDLSRTIRYWNAGQYRPSLLRWGWMPPHPTFYVRRTVYESLGLYDTSFQIAGDYELILRYLYSAELSVAYIPRVLMLMRVGGKSSRSFANVARKTLEDLRAWKVNSLRGGAAAVIIKNIRKIPQFVVRRGSDVEVGVAAVQTWRPRKPR